MADGEQNEKRNSRQHFVPQFYLRHWADKKERLWQYSVTGGPPVRTRTAKVAFERALYSHPQGKGSPLETETDLARIEGIYAQFWPSIIDRAEDSRTRRNVARFLGLMVARHPKHRQVVATFHKQMREAMVGIPDEAMVAIKIKDRTGSLKASEIHNATKDDKDTVANGFLNNMRDLPEALAEVLMQRRWGVVFSDSPSFLTSDCPVVLLRGDCRKATFGFGTEGTNVIFPVCPTRLIVIDDSWPHQFAHYKLADSNVFNRMVVQGAMRFVYGAEALPSLRATILQWRKT